MIPLRRNTKNGWTLLEIFIAVAVIGVLTAVVRVSTKRLFDKSVQKEILRITESFWTMSQICFMNLSAVRDDCDTKLELGFYCPDDCGAIKTPSTPTGEMTVLIKIKDVPACAIYDKDATQKKNLRMKGICHVSNTAVLPVRLCKQTSDCGTGETCYANKVRVDSATTRLFAEPNGKDNRV